MWKKTEEEEEDWEDHTREEDQEVETSCSTTCFVNIYDSLDFSPNYQAGIQDLSKGGGGPI